MDADARGIHVQFRAVGGLDDSVAGEAHGAGGDDGRVIHHRSFFVAGHERSVGAVGAVGERLGEDGRSALGCESADRGVGERQDGQGRVDRLQHGGSNAVVVRGVVVQRAVQLHVPHPRAVRRAHRGERADLGGHRARDGAGGEVE